MNIYEEEQYFKMRWILIPISIFTIIPILLLSKGEDAYMAILISIVVMLISGLLLFSMKQAIRIDESGIHFKQSPFHRKFHTIARADIQHWEIKKLNALGDFGGWGIRFTNKRKGYIIDGDHVLELKTNAKKITALSVLNQTEVVRAMEKHIGKG